MAEKILNIPLSRKDVDGLELRDVVYFNGLIFTGAISFHERAAQGILPPVDFKKSNVLLHVHPMMKRVNGKEVLMTITPTASIRFDSYIPDLIRKLGLRAVLGKTTLGHNTMKVMQEEGCVHCTRGGTIDNLLVKATKSFKVYFEKELGIAEATMLLEVEKFGPFLVDVDAHGNNLFYQMEARLDDKMKEIYKKWGISPDFKYHDAMSADKWKEAVKKD